MEKREVAYQTLILLIDRVSETKNYHDLSSLKGTLGILIHLFKNKGREVTPNDISIALSVSNPRVTFALNSLQNKGLIKKYRSVEDNRRINVMITPKGEEYVTEKVNGLVDKFEEMLKPLTEDESNELYHLLDKCLNKEEEKVNTIN